ncbi:MAG: 2-amino-4-hydroxy-6-hydroxymethyldihydropteridine diphosphokinase [Pseudohongiella sp.]|jgi:2-amino-4-hydroxy-6-hydroxymethyldihydropteridine diphosphokinase|nr:2-amino-4-hydroxy-6-hydroxymethyldihydropteridine diphosphokinase [Pseudohongiella sp.]
MSSHINTTAEQQATATAFVSLGSNLPSKFGSCEATLRAAIRCLASLSRAAPVVSSLYLTQPIDCPPGTPDFVNAAVALEIPVGQSPQDLLANLLKLETEFGRQRGDLQNQPRSLDLDLITYGNHIVSEEFLILPHPRAGQRLFVLQPIAEIDATLVLPGQSRTVAQLLRQLSHSQAPLRRMEVTSTH